MRTKNCTVTWMLQSGFRVKALVNRFLKLIKGNCAAANKGKFFSQLIKLQIMQRTVGYIGLKLKTSAF